MSDFTGRRAAFRKLHESGCFVIPNPWDAGSAKYLESLGFKALATTSSGYAFTQALPDDPKALDVNGVLANAQAMVEATIIPLNVDFQSGYSDSLEGLAENVVRCAGTGAAGLSIEDQTGDKSKPLYEMSEAVDRIKAARAALDSSGHAEVLLSGRAEGYLVGQEDPLRDSITRLQAYAEAGADVLFAPGIRTLADIRTLVRALAPKPVNVLIGWKTDFGVQELEDAGVRRISVGSGLSRSAWAGFMQAAQKLREGSFDGFEWNVSFAELDKIFR